MKPILYAPETKDFNNFGIGALSDAISCVCTQDEGCYELEIEYPLGGVHFDDIKVSSWIKASVPPWYDAKPQIFYVVNISRPISKIITITCHHMSYMLNFIPIDASAEYPFTCQTVGDAFEQLKRRALTDYPFNYSTNIGGQIYARTIYEPFMAMELLGGSEESISEMINCEFNWDNYTIICKDKVGDDSNIRLTYGVNITDFKQEENIAETITGVLPYWYDPGTEEEEPIVDGGTYTNTARAAVSVMLGNETAGGVTAVNNIVYVDSAKNFPFKRVAVLDLSSEIEAHETTTSRYEAVLDDEDHPIPMKDDNGDPKKDKNGNVIYRTKQVTETFWHEPFKEEIGKATKKWIEENKIGVPKVSFDISFEEIERYDEYSNLKPNKIKIFDEVNVIFKELGIETKAKVVKVVYDVLLDKYQKISIGEDKASGITTKIADVNTVEKKTEDALRKASLKALYLSQKNKDYAYYLSEFNSKYGEKVQEILDAVDNSSTKTITSTMTARIAAVNAAVSKEASDRKKAVEDSVDESLENTYRAISGANGGYARFIYESGSTIPKGLLISQSYSGSEAVGNSIIINHRGIGFSTDGGKTSTSAWGIDGTFNAQYLKSKTLTSVTIDSGTITTGTVDSCTIEAGTIHSTVLESALINAGVGLRFNYENTGAGSTGTIDVGVGSITTHLTANDPITWYGQIFQGSHPSNSTGTWEFGNAKKKDGILFDSACFAVSSKEFAISSSYPTGSNQYNRAGITTGNTNEAGYERVIMMAAHGPSNQYFSRVDCVGTVVGLQSMDQDSNGGVRIHINSANVLFNRIKRVSDLDEDDWVLTGS